MIKITGLSKRFKSHKVLEGLDLEIQDGETITIIGGSGTGKSVLLKHIVGLMKPDAGRISVDGDEITGMDELELQEVQNKFGFLFQGAALFDSLTVGENVAFALEQMTDATPEEFSRVATEKLGLVGLRNVEDLKPSELSGGMKKRVGLARAIAMDPKYILYDEPTTGLDPIMSEVITDLIKEIQDKLHPTSVVVTHDMNAAYKVSDRIAMLHQGKIVEIGTPDQIKNTKNPVVKQFITGQVEGPIKTVTERMS